MDNKPNLGAKPQPSHVRESAIELVEESKKKMHEIYDEGMQKVCESQKAVNECTEQLVKKVKENPLTSILVAAGVGFILSSLLSK